MRLNYGTLKNAILIMVLCYLVFGRYPLLPIKGPIRSRYEYYEYYSTFVKIFLNLILSINLYLLDIKPMANVMGETNINLAISLAFALSLLETIDNVTKFLFMTKDIKNP